MQYRKVGKSGLKISEISLGSWLTYGGSVDHDLSKKIMSVAIDKGVNFIDCADVYSRGEAEKVIGEFLKEETYNRKDLVISSKVFWPMSDNVNDRGLSRKHIMDSIEGTLERLNLDYVDIYYVHRFDRYTPLKETIGAMNDLIRSRKVNYWGTSVWTAAKLERVIATAKDMQAYKPQVEQPQYNMFSRYIELEVIETARRHGMGLTVFSPLAQGFLTGKYNDGVPDGSRGANTRWLQRTITDENIAKAKQLGEIAVSLNITMTQLALAWILRHPEISAAIVGATKIEHIEDNLKASEVDLSKEIIEKIEEILNNKPEMEGLYRPPF